MPSPANVTDFLPLSRHFHRLMEAHPELLSEVESAWHLAPQAAAMGAWLDNQTLTEDSLKPVLRRFKQRFYAQAALRDLAGRAPLAEVTETMTLIAELAIEKALAVLEGPLRTRHGVPRNGAGLEQNLIVIGMGKLGGRELNVSSDIDLIFVYPEDGDTDGERSISNFEYFTRLGRGLINAIADLTGDGQVFRVDMRLRPNGDSGPLVCGFEMLENYFITQGREWERYAWIKARPLTGERWDELEAIRRPFVYRKYLDFGSINAMRDLHAQIRREVAKKDMAANVKLGPGGIREIEFMAQVFQLIRGGRDRALQIKPTLQVLKLLAEKGTISLESALELASAYDFLRRVEHRLQYLDDAQTHSLPANPDDQTLLARSMGFASYDALLAELDDHRANVSGHFDAVFADPHRNGHELDGVWKSTDGGSGDEGCAREFERLGYKDPTAAAARLVAVRESGRYQQMPDNIRTRFDALVPQLVAAAAEQTDPDTTLVRLLSLLEAISRRAAYLALLQQYPEALKKVAQLASSSSWAADYLTRHPVLLDELLDGRILETVPDWPAYRRQLDVLLDEVEPDQERQMDLLRESHHAQVFRLLTQDISGLLPLEKLSDHLSELADIMLGEALRLAWKKLLTRHLETPRFAVIAYGKLGGKELGYASDLDLVFLYDDPADKAPEIYSRLSTRLNTWLSAQTPAGHLFETDLRLRPNGDSGLVVSSVDMFRKYQLESAWMWEHQALTRARFAAGDPAVGAAFEKIRIEVLRQKRDLAKLREEVLTMRQKMVDSLGTQGDERNSVFNIKHDPGGLVDVEFIIQYLILGHAHAHPELCGNLGNIALLRIAADLGLIPASLADTVRDAYRDYRRRQHALRLNGQKSRVDPASVADQATAVRELWHIVFN
ncbi:MAG: bifunctional [glutamate--ammonia ligase]-adenylyl-L-tyrosine phosphorylase/[glutamate--ammonia-ligase] adenylyltransferase [Rhodocyclaceae bacterium]|nr:bifunctional [glutamate--ammonia ligase]-adenylyl-L-tyrosine phosphorylase/[glutamate--ammonia-ligase] adenylyltransferase [Rhodocyclaceae bacterium]